MYLECIYEQTCLYLDKISQKKIKKITMLWAFYLDSLLMIYQMECPIDQVMEKVPKTKKNKFTFKKCPSNKIKSKH